MLHTKFRENRLAGAREGDVFVASTINGRGGPLDHVTRISHHTFVPTTHGGPTYM